jgi:hypothetical protein
MLQPTPALGAHKARGDGGACTQSVLRSYGMSHGKVFNVSTQGAR